MTARQRYLLESAARSLRDQSDPFCERFLSDHQVTFDEVTWLSATIGNAILAILARTR